MNNRVRMLLAGSCFLAAGALANAPAGRAVSVSGKVLVRNEQNREVGTSFLKAGDSIAPGSILNTGSTGAVKLLMSDRTIVDLGPSTLFKINDYKPNAGQDRQVDVSLDYGQVRTSVNQPVKDPGKFTIRTKAATMGVRGTEFVVRSSLPAPGAATASAPQTQVTVMHGRVDVQDAGSAAPMQVQAGMQLSAGAATSPQMTQLDASAVAGIQQQAAQKDMTFMQAVSVETSNGARSDSGSNDGANRGGNQTLGDLAQTMSANVSSDPGTSVHDVNLPGMFGGTGNSSRPIEYLNGRPATLKVRFCPSGSC